MTLRLDTWIGKGLEGEESTKKTDEKQLNRTRILKRRRRNRRRKMKKIWIEQGFERRICRKMKIAVKCNI